MTVICRLKKEVGWNAVTQPTLVICGSGSCLRGKTNVTLIPDKAASRRKNNQIEKSTLVHLLRLMGDSGNLITGGSEGRGPLQLALTLGTWALLLSILVLWAAAVLAALGYLGSRERGVRTELEEAGTDWTFGIHDFLLDTLAPEPGLEDAEEKSKKPKKERKEEDVIKEAQHKAGKKKRKEGKVTDPASGKKTKKGTKRTEKDLGITKPKKVKESSEKRVNGREKTSGKGHAEDCHQIEKKTDTKKKKDNRRDETKKKEKINK